MIFLRKPTTEAIRAFLEAAGFLESLMNFAQKLNTQYTWDVIPKRFFARNYVHDACGRVGIRFETEDCRPAMTLGFLHDESDHRVTFINRERGIDLLLRIEAMPKDTRGIQPVLDVLAGKRQELRKTAASVLLKAEPGNGNNYSVLVVRDCLADVFGSATTASDQLNATQQRLATWLEVLFRDGRLEKAFKEAGLDSGMA
jgi:hypothetical protein